MVFCNYSVKIEEIANKVGHNPYFNRWFSAINNTINIANGVTILILIDGFLQYKWAKPKGK